MKIHDSMLGPEVATRNLVNKRANELQLELQTLLRPYVGQKIVKNTPYRGATKKIKLLLEPIEKKLREDKFRLIFQWQYSYTLYAELDTTYTISNEPFGGRTFYVKRDIYICSLDGDILKDEFRECEPARTDYTVEEIISARADINSLEAKVNLLKSQIREFG